MILSIFVYCATVFLLCWGSVIAGKKSFNENYLSMDSSTGTKGLATLGVMLHHISQNPAFQKTGELTFFETIGYMFVAIFFFYSGLGLYKSWKTKPGYLTGFFKKRMVPIIVAIYVMNIFYAVFSLATHKELNAAQWVLGMMNLILMNDQGWFPIVILIMYGAFALAFGKCKSEGKAVLIIFLVALIQLVAFCIGGHFAWWIGYGWFKNPSSFDTAQWYQRICALWFQGEWWVNSTMCFVLGILWSKHEEKLVEYFRKNYWPKLIILFVLAAVTIVAENLALEKIGYWSEFGGHGVGRIDKTICLVVQQIQLFFLLIFLVVLKMKIWHTNRVLAFLSSISLEFYLMQRICLNSFLFLTGSERGSEIVRDGHWNLMVYFVAVMTSTTILALIYRFICRKVTKIIVK